MLCFVLGLLLAGFDFLTLWVFLFSLGTFGELALVSGRDWEPPENMNWFISSALDIFIVEVCEDVLLGHVLEGVLLVLTSVPDPVAVCKVFDAVVEDGGGTMSVSNWEGELELLRPEAWVGVHQVGEREGAGVLLYHSPDVPGLVHDAEELGSGQHNSDAHS